MSKEQGPKPESIKDISASKNPFGQTSAKELNLQNDSSLNTDTPLETNAQKSSDADNPKINQKRSQQFEEKNQPQDLVSRKSTENQLSTPEGTNSEGNKKQQSPREQPSTPLKTEPSQRNINATSNELLKKDSQQINQTKEKTKENINTSPIESKETIPKAINKSNLNETLRKTIQTSLTNTTIKGGEGEDTISFRIDKESINKNAIQNPPKGNKGNTNETTSKSKELGQKSNEIQKKKNKELSDETLIIKDEGGEWELLKSKITYWWKNFLFKKKLSQIRNVTIAISSIILLIIISKIYTSILHSIEYIPLANQILELIGMIWLTNYSINRILREKDQEK